MPNAGKRKSLENSKKHKMLIMNSHQNEYSQLRTKVNKLKMQQQYQPLPDTQEVLGLYSLFII